MNMTEHYNYEDWKNRVLLSSPDGAEVFLYDGDYFEFINEILKLDVAWSNGISPNPRIFPDYETHLDVIILGYFPL